MLAAGRLDHCRDNCTGETMDEVPVGGTLGGFTFEQVHLAVKNVVLGSIYSMADRVTYDSIGDPFRTSSTA